MTRRRAAADDTLRTRIETVTSRPVMTWLVAAYLVLTFTAMIWVTRRLDQSMRHLAGRAVSAVLLGNVTTLRLYVVELQQNAEKLLTSPEIHEFVEEALAAHASEPRPASSPARSASAPQSAGAIVCPPHTIGWVIVDPSGHIVQSDRPDLIGKTCALSSDNVASLRSEKSTLVLPSSESIDYPFPIMFVVAPLQKQNRFTGAFGWCINPHGYLSDRFGVTPTDSTYLFDQEARILSRDRFSDLRNDNGELASEDQVEHWTPTLVRDPGFYVSSPDQISATEIRRRPLTKMADQAIRGSAGFDTDGYTDYRGDTVIGAWQWLPDLNLGVAMEIDEAEAFGPVKMLRRVIVVMFLLLSLAGLSVAALAMWSGRLRARLQDRQRTTRRLGQYELTELLGAGGMGSVYRGRHQYLRRDVAIKVLEGEDLSAQAVQRFRREVQLTSTLRHPNTIAIYDYGQAHRLFDDSRDANSLDSDSVFYYVMEYVDGISLQQLLDYYGPQHPSRVIHILLQICGSIAEAHEAGLIHRDIKPANILLSAQRNSWDFIKVLDFGLVKELGKVNEMVDLTVTQHDSLTGTPLYMAPETIGDATQASKLGDLYSIGAVGYALLTGQPTYEGDSAIDLCIKQLEQAPLRPEIRLGCKLPEGLQDIIMSCLSLVPEQRPESINELVDRLDELPEAGRWTQADSTHWWETEFEGNRQQLPVQTKNPTLAGR